MMLAGESIWSRRLYILMPIAYADLLAHLGRELALVYDNAVQEPVPEHWAQLLRQLSDTSQELAAHCENASKP
jgi:hypothetical protein